MHRLAQIKQSQCRFPMGWSDPIDDEQAMDDDDNYNVGTYTVVHKMADGTYFTDRYGDNTDGNIEKADVADRMLMATVTGDGVAAGETVIFTFQNATASADAGPSTFQVYYDGAKVESDDDVVLVQSGEGAAMLALSSEEDTFLIDDSGTLTVTVMLQAADGSAATRAVDTTVIRWSPVQTTVRSIRRQLLSLLVKPWGQVTTPMDRSVALRLQRLQTQLMLLTLTP